MEERDFFGDEIKEDNDDTVCKRCGEFISTLEGLTECPICGLVLIPIEDTPPFCYGTSEDCNYDDF